MGILVRTELRKALSNRWFAAALLAATILAISSALFCIVTLLNQKSFLADYPDSYWSISGTSCFRSWLAVDFIAPTTGVFWLTIPLLGSLAYSWSYASERQSGYIVSILSRTKRMRYFCAKLFSVFIAGGLVVVVPLVIDILLLACFLPAYTPDAYDLLYHGIVETDLFSDLYYRNPLLFVAIRTLLDFVLIGLWSAAVFALSPIVRNRITLIVVPYLLLIFTKYMGPYLVKGMLGIAPVALSLLDHLPARSDNYTYPLWIYFVDIGALAIVIIAGCICARKRDVL